MCIWFLCTAHKSLSQQLLSRSLSITVEYALSLKSYLAIFCPFLTTRLPHHQASALEWLPMGDDGTETDSDKLLLNDGFQCLWAQVIGA